MRMVVVVVFIFALSLTPIRADSRKNISIETRPGVSVSVLMLKPDNPKAALIMLPGGPGMAKISGTSLGRTRGFITANFENFAAYSLAVAIVDTPSDRPDGLSPRFRQTGSHLKDLEAVIRRVRQETKLPVWLIGIRGALAKPCSARNSTSHSKLGAAMHSAEVAVKPRIEPRKTRRRPSFWLSQPVRIVPTAVATTKAVMIQPTWSGVA